MAVKTGRPEPTLLDDAWAVTRQAGNSTQGHLDAKQVDAFESTRPRHVGIVFVHGIGSQPAGETLFDWARPIVRTLWAWGEDTLKERFEDPVEVAQVDLTGQTTGLIQVRIPEVAAPDGTIRHEPQVWIMTEAWWAADIKPPGIGEMVGWGRRYVGSIVSGIKIGIRRSVSRRADPTKPDPAALPPTRTVRDWLDDIALRSLFTAAATVAAAVYGVIRILQALPIPKLKEYLTTAPLDSFLTQWFGDVRIILRDRAQAANLRMQLATTVEQLRAYGADDVILVAHSGGTILSYMLLADERHQGLGISKLITHGQAIGLAWRVGGRDQQRRPEYDDGLRDGDRLLGGVHRSLPDGAIVPRWVDFHATHDVAPAFSADGWPTPKPPTQLCDGPDESWTVANRMSVVNDHGGYWDNEEEFVIPLLRELDTPGGAAKDSRFYAGDDDASRFRVLRRESRVRHLSHWWNGWMVLLGLTLATGAVATIQSGEGLASLGAIVGPVIGAIPFVGLVAGLPAWLVGAAIVGILYFVASSLGVAAWNDLDVRERIDARRLAPTTVRRHVARGRMLLLLATAVPNIVLAIRPTWPWEVTGWTIPLGSAWEFPARLLPLLPTAALTIAALIQVIPYGVGRAFAPAGWLPEYPREPGREPSAAAHGGAPVTLAPPADPHAHEAPARAD